MPVPEFYKFMRPVLELLADNQVWHVRDIEAAVVPKLGIGPAEQQELIPSGAKTRVRDRTEWSLTYLRQAQLVSKEGPGSNKITARGQDYLKRAPVVIRPPDLMEFPEFVEFKNRTNKDSGLTKVALLELSRG